MSELTGQSAQTIHRLLEAGMSDDHQDITFRRDEDDPLDCDAVILDECSMVDISLMCALLRAMRPECRLILVGDADQLPSVGPGNVFSDIIRSGVVPTVRLTEIFRQAAGSSIVSYAHAINHGEHPPLYAKQRGLLLPPARGRAEGRRHGRRAVPDAAAEQYEDPAVRHSGAHADTQA